MVESPWTDRGAAATGTILGDNTLVQQTTTVSTNLQAVLGRRSWTVHQVLGAAALNSGLRPPGALREDIAPDEAVVLGVGKDEDTNGTPFFGQLQG